MADDLAEGHKGFTITVRMRRGRDGIIGDSVCFLTHSLDCPDCLGTARNRPPSTTCGPRRRGVPTAHTGTVRCTWSGQVVLG